MAVTIHKKMGAFNVLGLDPSTKTGWVVLGASEGEIKTIASGEMKFPKLRGYERLKAFNSAGKDLITKYQPQVTVIEGYGFSNKHTLVTLVEIGTMLRVVANDHGPLVEVPPTSLKKFTTGVGNAPKDKMMLEVFKRWGFEGTDNEVDAYALAMFGLVLLKFSQVPKVNQSAVSTWEEKHPIEAKALHLIALKLDKLITIK